jgi:CHAT domain-containing protein
MERIHAKEAFRELELVPPEERPTAGPFDSRLGTAALHAGDHAIAFHHFTRALTAYERLAPTDTAAVVHGLLDLVRVSIARANLATALNAESLQELETARQNLDRAIALVEKLPFSSAIHGPVLEVQAHLMLRLADHLPATQDGFRSRLLETVERQLSRALDLRQNADGSSSPNTLFVLNTLMATHMRSRAFLKASEINEQLLDITDKLQRVNPDVVLNMMVLAAQLGRTETVLTLSDIVMSGEEAAISELASMSGEAVALSSSALIRNRSMRCLALASKHHTESRCASAMLVIALRRKALITTSHEELWKSLYAIPDPNLEEARKKLLAARDLLSTRIVRGDAAHLWNTVQEIERREEVLAVNSRSRDFFTAPEREDERRAVQSYAENLLSGVSPWQALEPAGGPRPKEAITIERVASGLRPDSALIEFVRIDDFDADRDLFIGSARYWALVLRPHAEVKAFDLGDAAALEEALAAQLDVLHTGDKLNYRPQVRAMARLYELIWKPIAGELSQVAEVFLGLDGALATVPFAALLMPSGEFLVERYGVHIVSSTNDLTRAADARGSPGSSATIVADPDYDRDDTPASGDDSSSGGSPPRLRFSRLKGTRREGESVKELLGSEAELLTDAAASEAKVRALRHPRVLHLATHGTFAHQDAIHTESSSEYDRLALDSAYVRYVRALSRSGIALSGVNTLARSDQSDGFLTAFDVIGMDLFGTDLVVLSACDTGRGVFVEGEGVTGLGRSFRIAGARHVIMSLWRLSDREAVHQMRAFYRRFEAGENPAVALREVQRERVRTLRDQLGHTPPPALWAALTCQGN